MMAMLDFTSSLYLGLQHPAGSGRPWPALTLGRPAALQAPPGAAAVAAEIAALQGCEAGTLLPSTLHLFWDLGGQFGQPGTVVCVESGTYAIARWGVQRAAAAGAAVRAFAAGDAAALERAISAGAISTTDGRRRLLIVCDGVHPGHDRQPPLAAYAALAARHGGWLLLDDTQALGVVGAGGGGSLRHHGLAGAPVLVAASLAKGFGAPLAVLSGPRRDVRRFEALSQTRVHASPPSAASIEAARAALAVNRRCGDALRARLVQRVRQFRSRLAALRLGCSGGDFPVQQIAPLPGIDMAALHAALLARRVRAVLHADGTRGRARLSFIFNAALSAACVERAVQALAQAVSALRRGVQPHFFAEAS